MRRLIQALKEYGNHVQILTKGSGRRDFDLLDSGDLYGVTVSCDQPISDKPRTRWICRRGVTPIAGSILGSPFCLGFFI